MNLILRELVALRGIHESDGQWSDGDYDESEECFDDLSLLSHMAMRLRDRVPRAIHVKGGIPYHRAFTGKDIVSTIQAQIQRELQSNAQISASDRRPALSIARSLQSQLFFYEVEWGGRILQDSAEDVYMFLDDQEGGAETRHEQEELPTAVFTPLTKCYSPDCLDGTIPCYAYSCPKRKTNISRDISVVSVPEVSREPRMKEWSELIDKSILRSLPESEISRQTIIHKTMSKEETYVQDLAHIDTIFIRPLRAANPPVIPPEEIDSFMDDVFHNILEIRDVTRRLVEVMAVRQREQYPIIQKIGDVFLTAATDFRNVYPNYVGNLPVAEKRLKDELDHNAEFKRFVEQCCRSPEILVRRKDLKFFLICPAEHLQKYSAVLEAILNETAEGSPDTDFLLDAIRAIRELQSVSQLRTFQAAMGKGPTGRYEWLNLVTEDVRNLMTRQEQKRQSIIFELIKGEMMYINDLENINKIFVKPLRVANPPIIPHDQLPTFLHDVFHNFAELLQYHRTLLKKLHKYQLEEHPSIRSISTPFLVAVRNWHDAYMAYASNVPISDYRVEHELAENLVFKNFVERAQRHPGSRRLPLKNFISQPVTRLARYDLLLSATLKETPSTNEDFDILAQVRAALRLLLEKMNVGVAFAQKRVSIWNYNKNLVFKQGEIFDMDLFNDSRQLIHSGKLIEQPDSAFDWNGWKELFVLLFDHYLVVTRPKEKDGVTKYHVVQQPISLDLLSLSEISEAPRQRSKGVLRILRGIRAAGGANQREYNQIEFESIALSKPEGTSDSSLIYPLTIHRGEKHGGMWTVFAESALARAEWEQKLSGALQLREDARAGKKAFKIETLASLPLPAPPPQWPQFESARNDEDSFIGNVTCTAPFSTPDGRAMVAIGCENGLWVAFTQRPQSAHRIFKLKSVTQCAILEDIGILLILANKSLLAYRIETLISASSSSPINSSTTQRPAGNDDVQFFAAGWLDGRRLIIYMRKRRSYSDFRVLEPAVDRYEELDHGHASVSFSRSINQQSDNWFRPVKDFTVRDDAFGVAFVNVYIVILRSRGFQLMDLSWSSETISMPNLPNIDNPIMTTTRQRCLASKPIGIYHSGKDEFLLCYKEFGLRVGSNGVPLHASTVEWEDTAEHLAWHPPYLLLFNRHYIEIRHIQTGRLLDILKPEGLRQGLGFRCTWNDSDPEKSPIVALGRYGHLTVNTKTRIHVAINCPSPDQELRGQSRKPKQVFELVPTIPAFVHEVHNFDSSSIAESTTTVVFPSPT